MTIRLNEAAINRILPRVAGGLRKYIWLQAELRRRDVSGDREYQKCFNSFYRVRRDSTWQRFFYRILERAKSDRSSLSVVLRELHAATGRVEASFASKLVATIDPREPVIDSVVLKHLGLVLPGRKDLESRIAGIIAVRDAMAAAFAEYFLTAEGRHLLKRFRAVYPEARVTEVKMLDLVLWQKRSAA